VLAFDAYGTLLSTESIAKKLANHLGEEKAKTIATTWRKYQLEYTWRLNSMNLYEPFSAVTLRSLKHALKESGAELDQGRLDEVMQAYDSLSTFPDVGPGLEALSNAPGITAVVFSNGTHSMVSNSVYKSQDLSPYAGVFKGIVVVEDQKRFKPDPSVYHALIKKVGKSQESVRDVWLVSGNPFDITGARSVGMNAAWVDRAGLGWQDQLIEGEAGKPTVTVRGLNEVVAAVQ
ncbi:haloacid dehalogenase, partial [Patellaria atrata CBS 101060]